MRIFGGRPGAGDYNDRFVRKCISEVRSVILRFAQNLSLAWRQILRCAQNDMGERLVSNNLPMSGSLRRDMLRYALFIGISQRQVGPEFVRGCVQGEQDTETIETARY